jgi:hypothetical protein
VTIDAAGAPPSGAIVEKHRGLKTAPTWQNNTPVGAPPSGAIGDKKNRGLKTAPTWQNNTPVGAPPFGAIGDKKNRGLKTAPTMGIKLLWERRPSARLIPHPIAV